MLVKELRMRLHSRVNTNRRILRLTLSQRFEAVFTNAGEDERAAVQRLIDTLDLKGLEAWVTTQVRNSSSLEEMSMRDLRQIGQRLGVKSYNILTKSLLLMEISRLRGVKHESTSIG